VLREQTFGSGPVPRLVELSGGIFGPLLLKFSTLKFSTLKFSTLKLSTLKFSTLKLSTLKLSTLKLSAQKIRQLYRQVWLLFL